MGGQLISAGEWGRCLGYEYLKVQRWCKANKTTTKIQSNTLARLQNQKERYCFCTPVDSTVCLLFLGTCRLYTFRSSRSFCSWANRSIALGVIVGFGVEVRLDQFTCMSSRSRNRGEAHLTIVVGGRLQGSTPLFPTFRGPLTDLHQLKAGLSTA